MSERVGERAGACLRGCVRRPGSEGIPNVGIGVGGQGRQRHKVLRRQFPQKRPTNEHKRSIMCAGTFSTACCWPKLQKCVIVQADRSGLWQNEAYQSAHAYIRLMLQTHMPQCVRTCVE